ncbi:hypothetical protein GIB67_011361, partial [Kingdonia uniflora]
VKLIQSALTGTLNVLKAFSDAKIKRVKVISSIVSMLYNPCWPEDQVMEKSSYAKAPFHWYNLAKSEVESQTLEYAKRSGLDMVTVCSAIIFGPMLQVTSNATSLDILEIMKGTPTSLFMVMYVIV